MSSRYKDNLSQRIIDMVREEDQRRTPRPQQALVTLPPQQAVVTVLPPAPRPLLSITINRTSISWRSRRRRRNRYPTPEQRLLAAHRRYLRSRR
jgi:hypothetical protein